MNSQPDGCLALPSTGNERPVLVLHAWWGLNDSRAAYLGHFAETDEFEPQSNVDELEAALRRAGRPATLQRYHGTGHWFFEPDRPQFDPAAAGLAWDRTLAFVGRSPE